MGGMSGTWAVFRREFGAYFGQPVAYVVIVAYLLICGWFLNATLFLENQATLRNYFSVVPLILVFFAPAITMRLLAEEWKNGTMELLVTLPLRDVDVVLGKFLAAFAMFAVAQALTLLYPVTIGTLGNLDGGQVAAAYLGTLMMGGAMLSVGLWASALTRSQIVAFIVAFFICFALNMLGKVLPLMPGILVPLVELMALDAHFMNMVKGVVDSRDVLYFLSLTAFCLIGTITTLQGRKWGAG